MSGKGKKHKRGARGSIEEDNSIAKKQNMAAVEGESKVEDSAMSEGSCEQNEEEEISLKEIMTLLQNVEQTLQEMRVESRSMADEIRELKASFHKQTTEINTLKESLKGAEILTDQLNKSVECLKKKVENQRNEINELYEQQDNLEQYTRKNSLEIHGIPEDLYASTEQAVIKLGEHLQVDILPEDIDISHKLFTGKSNPKGIIVKFISHKKKTQLYKKRTALKKIKLADMFPGPPSAAIANSKGIFINENLTPFRKKVTKKANQLKKDNLLLNAWTLDGKIFVKTSPEGKPIRIYCEDDLYNL